MRVGKIGVVIIGLVPFNVYGECTPTPDCADMGYTETSCSGKFVRCPFDTSKLFCAPCDSKFQYTCSGDNITGGIGSACGGKYVSCECSSTDYIFSNGACVCPEIAEADCLVGAIYYPDGKCSNDYIICQNPVGVVVKDNALVMSYIARLPWGTFGTDVGTLTNMTSTAGAQADYNGKENTALIVAFQTTEGLTTSNSAAIYCNEYAPTRMESTRGKWYLPAAGEVYDYIYGNYNTLNPVVTAIGWTYFDGDFFWSSSEYSSSNAWNVISSSGSMGNGKGYKYNTYSVSCFFEIN